jgi:hypothetical protein
MGRKHDVTRLELGKSWTYPSGSEIRINTHFYRETSWTYWSISLILSLQSFHAGWYPKLFIVKTCYFSAWKSQVFWLRVSLPLVDHRSIKFGWHMLRLRVWVSVFAAKRLFFLNVFIFKYQQQHPLKGSTHILTEAFNKKIWMCSSKH